VCEGAAHTSLPPNLPLPYTSPSPGAIAGDTRMEEYDRIWERIWDVPWFLRARGSRFFAYRTPPCIRGGLAPACARISWTAQGEPCSSLSPPWPSSG
jgi:hypothetical protein